jgi:hypothetical protein
VIQRRTQTAMYWQQEFTLNRKDVQFLYGLILDAGRPAGESLLARQMMERHIKQEEETIRAELSKGVVYQPQQAYPVGEDLIFPALDYAHGMVVGTRRGRNPEYGEFTVIQVRFDGEQEIREFASELRGEHALQRGDDDDDLLSTSDLLSSDELYERHGEYVEVELSATLEEQEEFVSFRTDWFLRDLLVDIDLGYRNIAEALIEIKGRPLTTSEFLPDLDLPAEVPEEIRVFSLNHALDEDRRFDNVGDRGRDTWYLRRLIPEPVITPPARLEIEHVPYSRAKIAEELLLIEREIDDEGSGEEVMGPSRPLYKTAIALIYPHWRAGTLPLTVRTRGLFPESANHHSPVVLVDGQSGDRMQGWVVHGHGFVYGLAEWYKRYELPVGTYIKLERTRDPRVIHVDFEPRRLKRLWIRVAVAEGDGLAFQMRKLPVACEYDDLLTMSEDDPAAIDRLWAASHARRETLLQILMRIVPELLTLSPQGTVHSKAIYSAANVLKRVSPGPVFALLSSEPCFVPMGGGYWTFDETLVGS